MKRRLLVLLLLVLAVGILYAVYRRYGTVEQLIDQEHRLRAYVNDFPLTSVGIGFVLYVVGSLVPGTFGKAIIYGWLFGFWLGLLVVNLGLTIAAVLTFWAIRYIFQEFAHARLGKLIRRVDGALHERGPLYLLSVRLVGAPYSLTNWVAGATTAPTWTFLWTTQLGILPGNVALVLAGARLPSLGEMSGQSVWSVIDIPLLLALSFAALVPVGVRWATSRWRLSFEGLAEGGLVEEGLAQVGLVDEGPSDEGMAAS